MAEYGPQWSSPQTVSALLAHSEDEGCVVYGNSTLFQGHVALVQRGECSFVDKTYFAQMAGAVAVVVYNKVYNSSLIQMQASHTKSITIPSFFISREDGETLIQALHNDEMVNVRLNGTNVQIPTSSGYEVLGYIFAILLGLTIPYWIGFFTWQRYQQLKKTSALKKLKRIKYDPTRRKTVHNPEPPITTTSTATTTAQNSEQSTPPPPPPVQEMAIQECSFSSSSSYSPPPIISNENKNDDGSGKKEDNPDDIKGNSAVVTPVSTQPISDVIDLEGGEHEEEEVSSPIQEIRKKRGWNERILALKNRGTGKSLTSSRRRKNSLYDTGNCGICLEDFDQGEELLVLPCAHLFHEDCVGDWLSTHGTCPFCKAQIVPLDVSNQQGLAKGCVESKLSHLFNVTVAQAMTSCALFISFPMVTAYFLVSAGVL